MPIVHLPGRDQPLPCKMVQKVNGAEEPFLHQLMRRRLAKELVTRARAAMLTYMKDVAVDHGGFIEKVNALGDQESNGKDGSPRRKKSKGVDTKVIPGGLIQPQRPRPG